MPTIDTLTNRWNFIKYNLSEVFDKNDHRDDDTHNIHAWPSIYSYMIDYDGDNYE